MTAAVVAARDVRQGGEGRVKSGFGNWDNTDDEDWGGGRGDGYGACRGEINHRIVEMYGEDVSGERKKEGTCGNGGGGELTAK